MCKADLALHIDGLIFAESCTDFLQDFQNSSEMKAIWVQSRLGNAHRWSFFAEGPSVCKADPALHIDGLIFVESCTDFLQDFQNSSEMKAIWVQSRLGIARRWPFFAEGPSVCKAEPALHIDGIIFGESCTDFFRDPLK